MIVVTQTLIDVGGEVQPKTDTVNVGITHKSLIRVKKNKVICDATDF